MKVLSFKINEEKALELDFKVIGYGLEIPDNDNQWKDNNYYLSLQLEGFFTERIIEDIPPVFLTNEPFYSIDKVPFRLIRPFHLKKGWKLKPIYSSNAEYYLLVYAVPEKYPSEQYLNPTKIRTSVIDSGDRSRLSVEFPNDIRIMSFGTELSWYYNNDWWWGLPASLRARISIYEATRETDVWTDGRYARLLDWFGSLTLNGGKRVIKNTILRNTEQIRVNIENNIASYAPNTATQVKFFFLTEYANVGFIKFQNLKQL